VKTLGLTDQTSLPGFKEQKAQDPKFTAKQWAQESQQKYDKGVIRRLGPMGD